MVFFRTCDKVGQFNKFGKTSSVSGDVFVGGMMVNWAMLLVESCSSDE